MYYHHRTVEGNKNNQVAECKYVVNHPYIKGFGRPRYDAEPKTETPTPTTKPAEQKPATVTEYKIKSGDTLTAIAKKYGTTVSAIVKENGIKNKNLIIAGDTLSITV